MASMTLRCPDCGSTIAIDDDQTDSTVLCEKCGTPLVLGRPAKCRVFVSYSHDDAQWFEAGALIPWLQESLKRDAIELWYDWDIEAGEEFRQRIEAEIDASDVALLLLSEAFLSSDFIGKVELPRILDRVASGLMSVIPLLLEPCEWDELDFISSRQVVPGRPPKPLIESVGERAEFARVRLDIKKEIKKRARRLTRPAGAKPEGHEEPAPETTLHDTRFSAAWLAGDRLARCQLAWEPASQITPGARAEVAACLVELDRFLQWIGLPFPGPGRWPERGSDLVSAVTAVFEAQGARLHGCFCHGLHLGGFSQALVAHLAGAGAAVAGPPWDAMVRSHRQATAHAVTLGLPNAIVDSIAAMLPADLPEPDAAAADSVDCTALSVADAILMELRRDGAALTPSDKRTADRATPWMRSVLP
ncbi:MAG: TIR domain-containing protein [Acidobacteriota bacterium]|nr:TIR domain-containing protein [Acidobacteriota bacterium]